MPRGVPAVVGFSGESQQGDSYVIRTNAFCFFIACGRHLNKREMNILFNEAVLRDCFGMSEAIICIENGKREWQEVATNY